jgi:hypothetical protein
LLNRIDLLFSHGAGHKKRKTDMKHSLISMITTTLLVLIASTPSIQAKEPSVSHLSAQWQIWAYSTAAPSFIGTRATILNQNNDVLRAGSNGWTCMPGNARPMPENGWPDAHQAMPICADKEALKWMQAYLTESKPELNHDGFMWMLHGDVGEDNSTPMVMNKADAHAGHWIESGPHLMLMPKDPATIAGHTTNFRTGSPYLMFPNSQYAHLMIPVEGYYQYSESP